jgi:hypothetical protein
MYLPCIAEAGAGLLMLLLSRQLGRLLSKGLSEDAP